MLKLIMAVSADGFVSTSPDDDMSWTGPDDKKIFQLLTSVGGVLGAGRKTYYNLPFLKSRQVICISNKTGFVAAPRESSRPFTIGQDPTYTPPHIQVPMHTLKGFAKAYPEGWLIGGLTVAMAALRENLVGEVFLCRAPVSVHYSMNMAASYSPQRDRITPWLMSNPFENTAKIKFWNTTVEVWKLHK